MVVIGDACRQAQHVEDNPSSAINGLTSFQWVCVCLS